MQPIQTLKRATAAALVGVAVFLTGCASDAGVQKAYYEALKEQAIATKEIGVAQAQADSMKYYAIAKTSADADSTAKAAIGVALGVAGSGSNSVAKAPQTFAQSIVPPETTEQKLRAWAGIALGAGGLYVQDRNGERAKDVQIVNSNNSAAVQMNTNGAMLGLGIGKDVLSAPAPTEFYTNGLTIKRPEPQQ